MNMLESYSISDSQSGESVEADDTFFSLEGQFKTLASLLKGRIIRPGHSQYDDFRAVVPGNYDRRPTAVIRVANASDIAASLRFARDNGL